MNLSTANENFRQLVGHNVTYSIPPFQRDYSWTEENWEELWLDIIAMYSDDGEDEHYMGYLVLQSGDDQKISSVIDGQQRITTISIIVLSSLLHLEKLIAKDIDAENNREREKVLRSSYIGYKDPISLRVRSKLTLNNQNNNYYQSYLATNASHLPARNLKPSEHLLRKAYLWYVSKIEARFGFEQDSGEKVTAFIDSLVDKLFFTVISVTNELNAFKVFETLNARGVRLSSTDLLKNYIFSVISGEDTHLEIIKDLEDKWERITGLLNSESFPELLRVFWNSKNKIVRKKDLFKTIKKSVDSNTKAFALLNDLEYNAEIYADLRDPQSSTWNSSERDSLKQLNLYSVKQPMAMLMSAYRAFYKTERDTFTKILNAISVISFRYNIICNLPPQDQEGLYSSVAIKIENKDLTDLQSIFSELREIYPDDQQFVSAFKNKQLKTTNSRNQKVVQYILKKLEESVSGQSIDLETKVFNIEHILPQNPKENWPNFSDALHLQYAYRLANMIILEASINREIGTKCFEEKSEAFKGSSVSLTKAIPEHFNEWGPNTIDSRQNYLAKQAKNIWKIQGI
ncbi:DUF262 domain-containing protein [Vibrio aquimaris]|uniref:DUF262 domain-containing protein n=1 Tax=Vibrio aquimaris TaxID=2587862 RepID=A0A5P9CQL6_9VIBR|nr:DUF262 domain-containing protein [Vibrio aquimaris]QFT28253.1 hypothetical protein FIV01_17825 [Vibrio aquimaris]